MKKMIIPILSVAIAVAVGAVVLIGRLKRKKSDSPEITE